MFGRAFRSTRGRLDVRFRRPSKVWTCPSGDPRRFGIPPHGGTTESAPYPETGSPPCRANGPIHSSGRMIRTLAGSPPLPGQRPDPSQPGPKAQVPRPPPTGGPTARLIETNDGIPARSSPFPPPDGSGLRPCFASFLLRLARPFRADTTSTSCPRALPSAGFGRAFQATRGCLDAPFGRPTEVRARLSADPRRFGRAFQATHGVAC